MNFFEARVQGVNPDGRSGGNGSGNLPKPEYKAPPGFEPKIIKSTGAGIEIYPTPPPAEPGPATPGSVPSTVWVPPETGLH